MCVGCSAVAVLDQATGSLAAGFDVLGLRVAGLRPFLGLCAQHSAHMLLAHVCVRCSARVQVCTHCTRTVRQRLRAPPARRQLFVIHCGRQHLRAFCYSLAAPPAALARLLFAWMDLGWDDNSIRNAVTRLVRAHRRRQSRSRIANKGAADAESDLFADIAPAPVVATAEPMQASLSSRGLGGHAKTHRCLTCSICRYARNRKRWIACSIIDADAFPHTWLEAKHVDAACWGVGCRVCRWFFLGPGSSTNKDYYCCISRFASTRVSGNGMHLHNIRRHAASMRHRLAVAGLLQWLRAQTEGSIALQHLPWWKIPAIGDSCGSSGDCRTRERRCVISSEANGGQEPANGAVS